jgi:hypothetical protein
MRMPTARTFVGGLALELLDEKNQRIAANFVKLIARPGDDPAPRVEVLGARQVALRFRPDEFAELAWKDGERSAMFPSKFHAFGPGWVEYQIAIPDFVRGAGPVRLELVAELASKARDERKDWPSRRVRGDYPQTDGKKHRGIVNIRIAGEPIDAFDLPDDPADIRGVLSSDELMQHSSYGFLLNTTFDLASKPAAAAQVRDGRLTIRFQVPPGPSAKGLSIFGERLGRYPIDPTVILHTAQDVKQPVGWTSGESVASIDPDGN